MTDIFDIPFLITDINKEMPYLSQHGCKIPSQYGNMPKDFMKLSEKVNDRFLNKHLATIEEIAKKYPIHELPKWMQYYQTKYFQASLAHDGFFKKASDVDSRIKERMGNLSSSFISFLSNHGATITTGSTANHQTGWTGFLFWIPFGNVAVVNTTYDQLAINCFNSTGNLKIGAYNDSGGLPSNLYSSETTSQALDSAFTLRSITEFTVNTVAIWMALEVDNSGSSLYYDGAVSPQRLKVATYSNPFPSAATGTSSVNSDQVNCKMAHS